MDANGYPDERELKSIRKWNFNDMIGLFEYVKERWRHGDTDWREEDTTDSLGLDEKVRRYTISTVGWSGNESLIEAMQDNLACWRCWIQSRRGGRYIFEVPLTERKVKEGSKELSSCVIAVCLVPHGYEINFLNWKDYLDGKLTVEASECRDYGGNIDVEEVGKKLLDFVREAEKKVKGGEK